MAKFKFKPHDLQPWQTGLFWLWISILFFVLDQWTKSFAVEYFTTPGNPSVVEVMPSFNFILRYNTGAAFSFLAGAGGWQVYFFSTIATLVSLGIMYWLYTLPRSNRWLGCSLAFILAGAIGNLYDRLTLGKVVDFIDWYYQNYHWPAFNIADAVIMLGAVMMLLDGWVNKEAYASNDKSSSALASDSNKSIKDSDKAVKE